MGCRQSKCPFAASVSDFFTLLHQAHQTQYLITMEESIDNGGRVLDIWNVSSTTVNHSITRAYLFRRNYGLGKKRKIVWLNRASFSKVP